MLQVNMRVCFAFSEVGWTQERRNAFNLISLEICTFIFLLFFLILKCTYLHHFNCASISISKYDTKYRLGVAFFKIIILFYFTSVFWHRLNNTRGRSLLLRRLLKFRLTENILKSKFQTGITLSVVMNINQNLIIVKICKLFYHCIK